MLSWLLRSLFYILGFLCIAWVAFEALMLMSLMLKSTQTKYAHHFSAEQLCKDSTKGAEATFQVRHSILHLSSCFLQGSFQLQRAGGQCFSRKHL